MTLAKVEENLGTESPLPQGWRWVHLEDICDINSSRPAGFRRAPDAPTTFVPMSAVDEHQGTILSAEIRPFSEVAKGYTFFTEGDILFAKITPCMQNGKQAIARGLIDGIGFGSTEFHVIRPRPGVASEWIHRFVRQPHVLSVAADHFTGAVGQQRVPESFLASLEIPLPSIDEQDRIMHIVNKQITAVEKAHTAAEARLEAAKALPAAYLRQVFPKSDQELTDGWKWVRLGDLCEFKRGPFGGSLKKEIFVAHGYKVYEQQHAIQDDFTIGSYFIDTNKFREMAAFSVKPGDLIVSCSGTMGRVAIVPVDAQPGIINQALLKLVPVLDVIDPYYLKGYLLSDSIQIRYFRQTAGAAIQNVASVSVLKDMPVPVPSLTEQKHIAAMLNEQMSVVEKTVQTLQQELEAIDALSAALLRRAFTGGL